MGYIANPEHALTFGALNLIGTKAEYDTLGYAFEALGDDADWGNPVPIEVAVQSWLQDGANISIERHENRELFIRIKIRAASHDYLAIGEQVLVGECGKPNLIVWTPPDGDAAPCVFEVATSTLDQVTDDMADLRTEAVYGLKVKAFPFVRALTATTVSIPAPTGTQTVTSVDNGTSATGWSVSSGSVISSGGEVVGTSAATPAVAQNASYTLTRSGLSVNVSTTPYLRVQYTEGPFQGKSPTVFTANGIEISPTVINGSVYWFNLGAAGITTLNSFAIRITRFLLAISPQVFRIAVADISRSNVEGDQGTNRQLSRVLNVLGSERTQGTISLEDATVALGDVLVYTTPAIQGIAQPNLRAWRTSGPAQTPDSSVVSGFTSSLASMHSFEVPVDSMIPGTYALMARVRHTSNGDRVITWEAKSRIAGSTADLEPIVTQTGAATVNLTANIWKIVDLARLTLPTVKMGSNGRVHIDLTGVASLDLDEAWLFNLDQGYLTWVNCAVGAVQPGASSNRLFIESPTPDEPTFRYLTAGNTSSASKDNAYAAANVKSEGYHELTPPAVSVFTVTPNSTASVLGLSYFRRSHTRVVNT